MSELDERKKKRKKRKKAGTESSKESSLRDWFKRKGAKGKKGGWVDCNAPDGKGGYKSCGRSSGEKRKKYPACRPTPGACKERGRGKSWGKKGSKKKKRNENMQLTTEQIKKIIQEELTNVLVESNISGLEKMYELGEMEQLGELVDALGTQEARDWYLGKLKDEVTKASNAIANKRQEIGDWYSENKGGGPEVYEQADMWAEEDIPPLEDKLRQAQQVYKHALERFGPQDIQEKKGSKRIRKKKTKKDACYRKVKSRYKVWPSAYASGALTKCRKVGAKNWGNKSKKNETISESLRYHQKHGVGVEKNVFRPGSQAFFRLFREARQLFQEGRYKVNTFEEKEILESDLGEFGLYEGMEVPLDFPMVMEQDEMEFLDEKKRRKKKKKKKKDPPLNKPSLNTGGGKKWKVYVRSKSGGVKKVTYGDKKGGLKGNWNNAEARKSFAARHNCKDKKDKTTSGYWACRAHKDFGKNVPGRFW